MDQNPVVPSASPAGVEAIGAAGQFAGSAEMQPDNTDLASWNERHTYFGSVQAKFEEGAAAAPLRPQLLLW